MKEIKREEKEDDKDKEEADFTKGRKETLRSEKVKKMCDTVMVKIEL